MKNTKVLILAGGEGKRFWPLSTTKSLVKLVGKTVLEYNLKELAKAGFSDIIIVVNSKDNATIENLKLPNVKIKTVIQKSPKGMGDAVLSAKELLQDSSCLIMNAEDLVDDTLYQQIANSLKEQRLVIAGLKAKHYFDLGYLELRGDRVRGIIEKPGEGNEPSDLVNLVFHYYPDITEFINILSNTKSDRDDVYEKALSVMLKRYEARVITYDGPWYPMKYPWHVLDFMQHMLKTQVSQYRGKNTTIRANVVIEGQVYLGDNVKILENTKIVGPVFIGDNSIIGNNNLIRESQIGANCVTGFSTDITRSYVGDNCWFHSNYIGDSVLSNNVNLGSGAVLANLRLDEKNIWSNVGDKRFNTQRNKLGAIIGEGVRIGVNSSIMPGVKIGRNSMIGAGIVLSNDVPDDSFCSFKNSFTIVKNNQVASSDREQFRSIL